MSDTYPVNKGSDLEFSFNWPDGSGGNANLTGYTAVAFDVNALISANTTVTLTTPSTGLITVRIEWSDLIKTQSPLGFRVQISLGTVQKSTNELFVVYT
jgi:hypothetical protein